MTVHDIMTRKVVSCHADADIGAAARLMMEGGFGSLPVVNEHGRVIGMITDRDIALASATRFRNAAHIAVHEATSPRVRVCASGDQVGAALEQMAAARVRRLPVLDLSGKLVGILSIDDIVLRAVGAAGGIAAADFVAAMRRLCAQPSMEPDLDMLEAYTPG